MRLVIFGGTGGTGIFVVREALASGHEVTVVARTPSKVTESHPKLQVVMGDVTDGASIVSAVRGKDAVISALGAASRKPPVTIHATGIANIIAAMKQTGVRRLVAISSGGHYEGHDPNSGRFFEWIIRPFLRHVYADMHAMDALIIGSDLEWTIIRPPRLLDKPALGHTREALDVVLPKGGSIPRADLGRVVVQKASDDASIRHAVAVAT
jgi:uncharacterized protein YbjT (DUF2867 family)